MPTFDYGEVNPATGRIIRQPRKTVLPENGYIEPGDMRVECGNFFYYVKASSAAMFTPEIRAQIESRIVPVEQPAETPPALILNEAALDGEEDVPANASAAGFFATEDDETDG